MPTALDLIELRSNRVRVQFLYQVIDWNWNHVTWLHPDLSEPPEVTNDTSRTVIRTLSGMRILPHEADVVDIFQHRVALWLVFPDASDQTMWPLGVFMFTDSPRHITSRGEFVEYQLFDQTLMLDQPRRWGTSVDTGGLSISDFLIYYSVEDSPITLDRVNIDPTDARPSATKAWQPGAQRITILRELAAMVPYFVYFDNQGTWRGRPSPSSVEGLEPAVRYTQGVDVKRRVIGDGHDTADDLWKAPNLYVVVSTDANQNEISGQFRVPAEAPHSYENRRYFVPKVISETGTPSSWHATLRAVYHYLHDDESMRSIEWTGPPDPRHESWDVVEFDGENFLETMWSLRCDPAAPLMKHRAARVFFEQDLGSLGL